MKSPSDVRNLLLNRLFGRPIVQNNFRGELVEEMVAIELEETGWVHCSEDWASWDFRRNDQLLQVKQSAARQSWDKDGVRKPARKPAFSIRPNSGYYIGSDWQTLKAPMRLAQIYIFGWHGTETADADHFNFSQWDFFIAPVSALNALDGPEVEKVKGSIRLTELDSLPDIRKVKLDGLKDAVELISAGCGNSSIALPPSNNDVEL